MAEKAPHFQSVQSVGDSWIVARSKKYAERIYYFNTATGQALWNLSDVDCQKAARNTGIITPGGFPEPKEPPSDNVVVVPPVWQNSLKHPQMQTPRVYNKQIINNQYTKPFLYPPCMPQYYPPDMPIQYNPNLWAMPPPMLCNNSAPPQQVFMGPHSANNQFMKEHIMQSQDDAPPAQSTSFSNHYRFANSVPNKTIAGEINRQKPNHISADLAAASNIDLVRTRGSTGTSLSDRFKSFSSNSTSDEITLNSNNILKKQMKPMEVELEMQDLRKVLEAKRFESNLNNSGSVEEPRGRHNQEKSPSIEGDMSGKLEGLHVRSPAPRSCHPSASISASASTGSYKDDDDLWLSENMQLMGTKPVIDVGPLKQYLGIPEGNLLLIADTTVYLNNLSFLTVLINSDESCRLVVPSGVYSALQRGARGGAGAVPEARAGAVQGARAGAVQGMRAGAVQGARAGGAPGPARAACRFVAQLLNVERAFIDHQEVPYCRDPMEECCLRLIEQNILFVGLSNNKGLLSKINAVKSVAFSVDDIKECLTTDRFGIQNQIVDLPMTITIENNKPVSQHLEDFTSNQDSTVPSPQKTKDLPTERHKKQMNFEQYRKTQTILPHDIVPTEEKAPTVVTKTMVNAEVQTDILFDDNIFKTPLNVIHKKSQIAEISTEHATANKSTTDKKREIKLKRNTVPQSSTTNNTVKTNQRKNKWWRRRKTDSAQKPIPATIVTDEAIQKLIANAIAVNKKAENSETSTKADVKPANINAQKVLKKPETISERAKPAEIKKNREVNKCIIQPARLTLAQVETISKPVQEEVTLVQNPVEKMQVNISNTVKSKIATGPQSVAIAKNPRLEKISFSPAKDSPAISPERNESPKNMKDFHSQMSKGKKVVDESASSSDVISNTRSSMCSEPSLILQPACTKLAGECVETNKMLFEITDESMEESLKCASDEWISRFVQTTEEVLNQVLQHDPSQVPEISPPWSIMDATQCVIKRYNTNIDVRTTANEFSNALFEVLDKRGDIRRDLSPSTFLEIFSLAVNFVVELETALPNCEDIPIALKSLQQLLSDIKGYNSEEPMEFPDIDTFDGSFNVTSLDDSLQSSDTNRDKVENTNATLRKDTEQETPTPQQKVRIIRNFNCGDSFANLMEKRLKTNVKQVPRTDDFFKDLSTTNEKSLASPIRKIPKVVESPTRKTQKSQIRKTLFQNTPNRNTLNLQESPTRRKQILHKSTIVKSTNMQAINNQKKVSPITKTLKLHESPSNETPNESPNSRAILSPKTNQPLIRKQFIENPVFEDRIKKRIDLDMDVLDYSEDFGSTDYDYGCMEDDLDFANQYDFSQENREFREDKFDHLKDDFITMNENVDNLKESFNNVKENLMDNNTDNELLVRKFFKEINGMFLRVNTFCEETCSSLRSLAAPEPELTSRVELVATHLNKLLTLLNSISSRDGECRGRTRVGQDCDKQIAYGVIIEKITGQAKIFLDVLSYLSATLAKRMSEC